MQLAHLKERVKALLPIFFTLLTYVTVGVDMLSYPGYFAKHFLLDSRLMVFLSLMVLCALTFRNTTKQSKLTSRLISLNSYLALPLLTISTGALTLLEYLRYPNFVFTTFHVQYGHLAYALLLSVAIYIFSLKKTKAKLSNKIFSFMWLSIFLLYMGLFIETSQNYIFPALSVEDGVFEWLEFFFFLSASIISFLYTLRSLNKRDILTAVTYGGFAALLFFIAGEEISWGQRIFHIATPDAMRQINEQGEITLHNLNGINEKRALFYIIFSSYFALLWIPISLFQIKIHKKLQRFISPWYISLFFVPMLLITSLGKFETVWQEYGELTLSLGVFLYALETTNQTVRRTKLDDL